MAARVSEPHGRHQPQGPVRRWARTHPADIIDVFVYVVVLNLAVEYLPAVISEGFTLSLLTALLLKLALEVVLWIKAYIIVRLRAAKSRPVKVAIALTLWVVAAGSKFVVLKLVELVFGDSVSLGGFLPVTALIVTLLFARGAVRRLLDISLWQASMYRMSFGSDYVQLASPLYADPRAQ